MSCVGRERCGVEGSARRAAMLPSPPIFSPGSPTLTAHVTLRALLNVHMRTWARARCTLTWCGVRCPALWSHLSQPHQSFPGLQGAGAPTGWRRHLPGAPPCSGCGGAPHPSLRPPRPTSAHCWARWAGARWAGTGAQAFPTLQLGPALNKWRWDQL